MSFESASDAFMDRKTEYLKIFSMFIFSIASDKKECRFITYK